MSDKGRRRKARESGDSEKLSEDSYEDNEIIKGSEEEGELNASTEGTRESEYDIVEDDTETDDSTAVDGEDGDDDSVIIEYEREEGDGQVFLSESIPPKEKKLDDDEDRRNPQYIPKRGTFYEHDDRTATEDVSGGDANDKEAADRASKEGQGGGDTKAKKVWREHENRWSHDRYNADEQAPKSCEELIAVYGYDIRNEEGPPRARRRRRYGRGPNKYTRNWEDEDAYSKPQVSTTSSRGGRRGGRRGGTKQAQHHDSEHQEEFPPLINNRQNAESGNNSVDQNPTTHGSTYSNQTSGGKKHNREDRRNNMQSHKDSFPPLESESHRILSAENPESLKRPQITTGSSNMNNGEESSGVSISSAGRRVHHDTRDGPSGDSGARSGRGRGHGRGRGREIGNTQPQHHQQQQQQQQLQQLQPGVSGSDRRQQVVVPPRMQQQHQQDNSGSNRPKRYSSLRQRSLPESGATYAQPPPPAAYYQPVGEMESNDSAANRPKRYSTIRSCSGTVYAQPDHASTYFQPAAGYVTQQPVYGDTPQPQSAGTPPLQLLPPHAHPPAPAYAAPFPSPATTFVGPPTPRILPPGPGAHPAFIPPTPGAPIINYVAPQPTYTAFQGYTAVATPGPPPTELYQPQGGITYYNTEEQNIARRTITLKREKSAIPIVPPPERAPRGRGRTSREETSPGESGGAGDSHTVNPPAVSSPPATAKFEDASPSTSASPTATKVA
ncbi:hypothetical protein Cfor_02365 [Coptotermes formosanus]|uniref:Protein CASC3 n=1 Tax=Coptotermes formosanus TaxID=36987 RepID=A0A6L2Q112_COPFO|nr:hypothetical protein Cfor_02365 [Coptotermes formosanus]